HARDVEHAAFSPDGTRIVTASDDRTARVWDAATGEPVTPPLRHGSRVLRAHFSPDGTRVVTASDDNTARVWGAADGSPRTPPLRHEGTVQQAAFSPDGRLVATASADRTARVWDAATGEPITPPLRHRRSVADLVFNPAGNRLLTAGVRAQLWRLEGDDRPAEDLQQLARLLAESRVEEAGGLVPLETDEVRAIWDDLRPKYPELFAATPEEIRAWHQREIAECEASGCWHGATWHIDRLLAAEPRSAALYRLRAAADAGLGDWQQSAADAARAVEIDPDDWDALLLRGQALAHLGQWAKAAADFGKNRDVGRDEPEVWRLFALASLAAGDRAGYRRGCATLLDRFATGDDAATRLAVWTAALSPESGADPSRLVRLAEQLHAGNGSRSAVLRAQAAALYRAGRCDEAAAKLREALRGAGAEESPYECLLMTMVCQRRKQPAEARRWLERAGKAMADGEPVGGRGHRHGPAARPWDERLELDLLRREAEAAGRGSKPQ
ncbi:MAG TPA: tetratricopeptide repeat protein, partial [Gemmataceae bacterium]|nr:tetratricopeptide repeat protein [Gemmataceae bacterium]